MDQSGLSYTITMDQTDTITTDQSEPVSSVSLKCTEREDSQELKVKKRKEKR